MAGGSVYAYNTATSPPTRYNVSDAGSVSSVKAFGAVGDNSTDDTLAIQAAIDAVAPGGTVFFPNGTYRVTSVLTVTTTMTLCGESGDAILYQFGGTSDIMSVSGTDVRVCGLEFRINATGTRYSQLIITGANCVVENCRFIQATCNVSSTQYWCIYVNGARYTKIVRNHFQVTDGTYDITQVDTTFSLDRDGIHVGDGSNQIVISENTSFRIGVPINVQGIDSVQIKNVTISNNTLSTSANYGILLYTLDTAAEANFINNVSIVGNNVDTVYGNFRNPNGVPGFQTHGAGIYLQSCFHTTVSGNTVRNCAINSDSETLTPACIATVRFNKHISISGNTCETCPYYGISAAGENMSISGNSIVDCDYGIYSKNTCKYVSIVGNCIENRDAGIQTTSSRGIFISGGTAVKEHIVIMGNTITNHYVGISTDAFTTYCTISGNSVFQDAAALDAGQGITTDAATDFASVCDNVIKRNAAGFGIRALGTHNVCSNNVIDGGAAGQMLQTTSGNGCMVSLNQLSEENVLNENGTEVIAAAADIVSRFGSPGVLIELTGAATVNTLNFGITDRQSIHFYILSQGAGNTIAHNAAGTGTPFLNSAGVNLAMTADTVYAYRYVPHLTAFVQY